MTTGKNCLAINITPTILAYNSNQLIESRAVRGIHRPPSFFSLTPLLLLARFLNSISFAPKMAQATVRATSLMAGQVSKTAAQMAAKQTAAAVNVAVRKL